METSLAPYGAGDGNRTRVLSLGSSSSAIEPRPREAHNSTTDRVVSILLDFARASGLRPCSRIARQKGVARQFTRLCAPVIPKCEDSVGLIFSNSDEHFGTAFLSPNDSCLQQAIQAVFVASAQDTCNIRALWLTNACESTHVAFRLPTHL